MNSSSQPGKSSAATWDNDMGILLSGEAVNLQVFCCMRDDFGQNVRTILRPVTATTKCMFSTMPAEICETERLAIEVAIDAVEIHFSKQSLTTIVKILTAMNMAISGHRVAPSLSVFTGRADDSSGGDDTAVDEAEAEVDPQTAELEEGTPPPPLLIHHSTASAESRRGALGPLSPSSVARTAKAER